MNKLPRAAGVINMSEQQFEKLKRKTATQENGSMRIIKGYKKGGVVATYKDGNNTDEPLNPGIVTTGIFEGRKETLLDSGDTAVEYQVREEDDTLVILKACKTLNDAETGLMDVKVGELVRIEFIGIKKAKNGRNFAMFEVERAINA